MHIVLILNLVVIGRFNSDEAITKYRKQLLFLKYPFPWNINTRRIIEQASGVIFLWIYEISEIVWS
jgi:hypothetical protein